METQVVMDGASKVISVGTRILAGYGLDSMYQKRLEATVFEITDVDADYDDGLQRPVMYPPKVKFRYSDGTEDEASTSYIPIMSNPEAMWFVCEDLEVVEGV